MLAPGKGSGVPHRFGRIAHRPADFLAQNLAITGAQSLRIFAQRCCRPPQPRRQLVVGDRFFAIRREVGLERFKQGCFASKSALLRKASERLPKQGLSPLAIVNPIRLPAFVARDLVFRFRNGRLIERLANFSAAPLLSLLAIARIGDEMFQRAEEKGTEAALLAISSEVGAIPNEFGEKSLRQILRILGPNPFASQKKIKRPPINSAKLRERIKRARGRKPRISAASTTVQRVEANWPRR